MEGRAAWVHQQQSRIGFDELTSMVSEMMNLFEREQDGLPETEAAVSSDWISPSGLTRVVRHGSSAALQNVLMQEPDAVSAEFEILHCGTRVFSWCEYLWPHLQRSNLCQRRAGYITLPTTCLNELMQFHKAHDTSWLRRYQLTHADESAWNGMGVKVDEIGVVAEPDSVQVR